MAALNNYKRNLSQKSAFFASGTKPGTKDPLKPIYFILNHDSLNVPREGMPFNIEPLDHLFLDEIPKLSETYDGPGFPLDDYTYSPAWSPDKKRSILRSLIAAESKRTNLRFVYRDKGLNKLLKRYKKSVSDELWPKDLSISQMEKRHYFHKCKVFGKRETSHEGKLRDTVFACNQRKLCPGCSERYYAGHALQIGKKIVSAMEAMQVGNLRKFRVTLPEHIRTQVKTEKEMSLFGAYANRLLQELFGCEMKGTNHYLNGSVGLGLQDHWYSTKECFRKSPHIHAWVVPIQIKDGAAFNVDRRITKFDLLNLREKWAEYVKKASKKLGYNGLKKIPDSLVIHTEYIPVLKNKKEKGKESMNLKYDYRSPGRDLINAIVGMDFSQDLLVMKFHYDYEFGYYAIWKMDDFFELMKEKLAIKRVHMTYGWFRRYEKFAPLLDIQSVESKDDFNPDLELTVSTVYRRFFETTYNKEKRRLERKLRVFVRKIDDPDEPKYWEEVNPYKVRGETVYFSGRKVYDYVNRSG